MVDFRHLRVDVVLCRHRRPAFSVTSLADGPVRNIQFSPLRGLRKRWQQVTLESTVREDRNTCRIVWPLKGSHGQFLPT